MKNKIFFLFILLVSFIISNSFFCTKENNCNSVDKVDLLIKEVLSKLYIYMSGPGDTSDTDYLIANEFIKSNKEYTGPASEYHKIITVNKNESDTLDGGRIYIDRTYFNLDTTTVELKVQYLTNNKRVATTTLFRYRFSIINCKWILEDSTRYIH